MNGLFFRNSGGNRLKRSRMKKKRYKYDLILSNAVGVPLSYGLMSFSIVESLISIAVRSK